jgi:hypothetical protein
MPEGKEQRLNRLRTGSWSLPLLWFLLGTSILAEASAGWTLENLMQTLASVERRQARFTEIRELALLQQDLTSTGSLSFQRPDSLVKQFDPPEGLRYEITAKRLLIRRRDGSEEIIRLDNAPQLLAYVAAMQAVLAGDLERLASYFELHLEGTREAWQLRLTPKEPGLARQVNRVEITGADDTVMGFVIVEQGGDRIITRLHQPDAQ